ncbi:unnamed protein product [Miscanthus lutarioriparius]|uniref:Uncharacterized protein n=1 Tax=Miscanthus lutarioriparius TaxID=422564 RepID=A0A811MRR3_9POAL|nr:unnamed protein product [Miscanthus lutarioriparius]
MAGPVPRRPRLAAGATCGKFRDLMAHPTVRCRVQRRAPSPYCGEMVGFDSGFWRRSALPRATSAATSSACRVLMRIGSEAATRGGAIGAKRAEGGTLAAARRAFAMEYLYLCERPFRLSGVKSAAGLGVRSSASTVPAYDLHTSAGRSFALGRYTHLSISAHTAHDTIVVGYTRLYHYRRFAPTSASPSARFPLPSPNAPRNKQENQGPRQQPAQQAAKAISHVVLRRPARGVVDRGGVHAVAAAVPGDPDPAHGDAPAGRLLVLHLRGLHRGGVAAAELGAAGRAHRARPPHPLDLLRRLLRGLLRLLPQGEPLEGLRAPPAEGSSPWGVAMVVLLLLVLASFHSTIQDMWRP